VRHRAASVTSVSLFCVCGPIIFSRLPFEKNVSAYMNFYVEYNSYREREPCKACNVREVKW